MPKDAIAHVRKLDGLQQLLIDHLLETSTISGCIQSLKMRNKETNRDLAEFFGNKWDGFR